MELIAYITMACGAYICLVVKQRAVLYGWFAVFVAYSLIVRSSPPTLDMVAYSISITTWPPPLTPYTLREPLIWLGAPLLHKVIGSQVLTFLIIDILSGIIVIRALDGLDVGNGRIRSLAPVIIVSYVFLMGQQNAWRQQVALVIFLWSCSARLHSVSRGLPLLVLSFLAHNSTALLVGYWFDGGRTGARRYGPLITLIGVFVIALQIPYLDKSSSTTGLNTEYLYIAVTVVLGLILLYATTGRLPDRTTDALLNFVAFCPAIAVLGSTQFERMGMMFLVLILLDMYRHQRSLRLGEAEVANLVYAILVVQCSYSPMLEICY